MIGASSRGSSPNPLMMPGGIRDADELSMTSGVTEFSILYDDLTPQLSPMTEEAKHKTGRILHQIFGDQIDVRFSAYLKTTGLTRFEKDVALVLVREGFLKMVLVPEAIDNNNYANNSPHAPHLEPRACVTHLMLMRFLTRSPAS